MSDIFNGKSRAYVLAKISKHSTRGKWISDKTLAADINDDACTAANINRAMRGQYFEHAGVFQCTVGNVTVYCINPGAAARSTGRGYAARAFNENITIFMRVSLGNKQRA